MTLLELNRPQSAPVAPPSTPWPVSDIVLPLEGRLARYGASTRISLVGREDAPLLVVLGGISADRFPCLRADGGAGWWCGLAGDGRVVDPADFRILGLDFIADPLGRRAPETREQAEIVCAALDHVGIGRARAVIGASYGGMIALALGQHFPERAERLVVISADASPHPASTAMRELQRRVVALGLETGAPEEALSIARGLAMMTYRTRDEFAERFDGGIAGEAALGRSQAGDYLRARGAAFCARMTPQRFLSLSASIDRHRIDPDTIALPTLLIGADSDQLVPPAQMERLAAGLAGKTRLHLLPSLYGHDMFLKDAGRIADLIAPFLRDRP